MTTKTICIHPTISRDVVENVQAYARMQNTSVHAVYEQALREFLSGKEIVDPAEGLLSSAEIMDILGCTRRNVHNLIDRGSLAGVKIGRNYFASLENVKAYQTRKGRSVDDNGHYQ